LVTNGLTEISKARSDLKGQQSHLRSTSNFVHFVTNLWKFRHNS